MCWIEGREKCLQKKETFKKNFTIIDCRQMRSIYYAIVGTSSITFTHFYLFIMVLYPNGNISDIVWLKLKKFYWFLNWIQREDIFLFHSITRSILFLNRIIRLNETLAEEQVKRNILILRFSLLMFGSMVSE